MRSLGLSLAQIVEQTSQNVSQGDLAEHVPIPTGFDILDRAISKGLRRSELALLGGPVGVGKTVVSLQMARNIASRPGQYVVYLSYEHDEIHLFHRLLCLESTIPSGTNKVAPKSERISLKDIHNILSSPETAQLAKSSNNLTLPMLLGRDPRAQEAMKRMRNYANRLILLKAGSRTTDLTTIENIVEKWNAQSGGKIVLFVDYLQKVAVTSENYRSEDEKVTIIVETLKDIAMRMGVPIWSIVAADREGLKSRRMHLYHLRGSSALDYECDIAMIMTNKYSILHKDIAMSAVSPGHYRNWVVFTIEKNRAGHAFQELEFQIHGENFGFNPTGKSVPPNTLVDDRPYPV